MEEPQSRVFVGTCVFNLDPQRFFWKGRVSMLSTVMRVQTMYILFGVLHKILSPCQI